MSLFLHHPSVAGFSQGLVTVVVSVLKDQGYSPSFRPVVPDFFHRGNARLLFVFPNSLCFGLANVLIVCNCILYEELFAL